MATLQQVVQSTLVNAGFNRKTGRRWEHRNVQGILVPLPPDQLSSAEFRGHVRQAAPEGEGWQLTGYALVRQCEHSWTLITRTEVVGRSASGLPLLSKGERIGYVCLRCRAAKPAGELVKGGGSHA